MKELGENYGDLYVVQPIAHFFLFLFYRLIKVKSATEYSTVEGAILSTVFFQGSQDREDGVGWGGRRKRQGGVE